MNKNLDLVFDYSINHRTHKDEIFDQVYIGSISLIERMGNFPIDIGNFVVNIINLETARKVKADLTDVMETLSFLDDHYGTSYQNINKVLHDFYLNLENRSRIIFVHSVYIHPTHRGKGISKELMKSIYTTLYSDNSFLFTNGTPVQQLDDDYNFSFTEHILEYNTNGERYAPREHLVGEYHKFNKLPREDQEINEFKIFGLLNSLNMKRFGETPFFYYEKEKNIIKLFNN